jgi:uncharacterized protein (UPF0276 family)
MIELLDGEKWKQVVFDNWDKMQRKYAVSNMGRVASYDKLPAKDGSLLNGSIIEGYLVLRLKVQDKYIAYLFHRLVAEYFLKKPKANQKQVIHINHDKKDNKADNLRWASKEEVAEHSKTSPAVLAYRIKAAENKPFIKKGLKLNITQVKQIKKLLQDKERKLTYKKIAAKYGISEMAITRINRGENWGHVVI